MDGPTAGGGPAWAVATRARWRGSREAAGRVRPAVRPPSDAGPARRLRYAAAGTAGPSPLAVFFLLFFFPFFCCCFFLPAATEAGALLPSVALLAGPWQAHSWVLKRTHRARERSPGPRLLPGVSEPWRVGLAGRARPSQPGDGGGSGVTAATPRRMRSTAGLVELLPSGEDAAAGGTVTRGESKQPPLASACCLPGPG